MVTPSRPRVNDEAIAFLRALLPAKRDRTRVTNRMKGLLASYGVRWTLRGDVEAQGE